MKQNIFKRLRILWTIILIGIGLFSVSGQDGVEVTSVQKLEKASSFNQNILKETVHECETVFTSSYAQETRNERLFEIQEEEDDRLSVSKIFFVSDFFLPQIPWFTQTNNYKIPFELYYGKQTCCLYLKNQVFLI